MEHPHSLFAMSLALCEPIDFNNPFTLRGEAYSAPPRPPSWFWGAESGGEGRGKREGGEGQRGRKGREFDSDAQFEQGRRLAKAGSALSQKMFVTLTHKQWTSMLLSVSGCRCSFFYLLSYQFNIGVILGGQGCPDPTFRSGGTGPTFWG